MNEIIIYETLEGYSGFKEELENLARKSLHSKDARIQLNQIILLLNLLQQNGTNLPIKIAKHIQDDIWELRPGHNRILYFHFRDGKYIILHMFRKKTNKTPKREIEKAIKERNDFFQRNGGES